MAKYRIMPHGDYYGTYFKVQKRGPLFWWTLKKDMDFGTAESIKKYLTEQDKEK